VSRLNIRWRLTGWYGAVLAATLTVFGAAVSLVMRHVLLAKTGAGMSMESIEVQEEVARTGHRSLLGSSLGRRFARHPGYDIQVGDPGGKPLFRSDRLRDEGLPVPSTYPEADRDAYGDFRRGRAGRFRLLAEWVDGGVHHTGITTAWTPNKVTGGTPGRDLDINGRREKVGGPTFAAITARSYHLGRINILLGDGSVRFVKDSIAGATWRGLGSVSGGEVVSADSYSY